MGQCGNGCGCDSQCENHDRPLNYNSEEVLVVNDETNYLSFFGALNGLSLTMFAKQIVGFLQQLTTPYFKWKFTNKTNSSVVIKVVDSKNIVNSITVAANSSSFVNGKQINQLPQSSADYSLEFLGYV